MTNACPSRAVLLGLLVGAWVPGAARGDDLDREPIRYATAGADNAVSRLQKRVDSGEAVLAHEPHFGYLRPLLRELNVPVSSQALVFSKTSFQRDRISPRSPRAVYFGDDAYVGFCQGGDVLEVAAADPQLGTVFYTLGQRAGGRPRFVRQTDDCLTCHASSLDQGSPGLVVRSLYVDGGGLPLLALGGYRTDHTSPLAQRWGGWYVTGTSGSQGHLGNLVLEGDNPRLPVDNAAGRNVTDLCGRLRTAGYLSPHSDLVALLVLEHQAEMHNRIARAALQTRLALYEEADVNRALGRPAGYRSESTARRVAAAGEALVQYLLFAGEAPLSGPVAGTSGFAGEFAARATAAAGPCATSTCAGGCSGTRAATWCTRRPSTPCRPRPGTTCCAGPGRCSPARTPARSMPTCRPRTAGRCSRSSWTPSPASRPTGGGRRAQAHARRFAGRFADATRFVSAFAWRPWRCRAPPGTVPVFASHARAVRWSLPVAATVAPGQRRACRRR
jgi:hypothetical protein